MMSQKNSTDDFAKQFAAAPDATIDDLGGVITVVQALFEPIRRRQQSLTDPIVIAACARFWKEPGFEAVIREQLRLLGADRRERDLFLALVEDRTRKEGDEHEQPGMERSTELSPWDYAEALADFLATTPEIPEGLVSGIVYPGGVTSIAAPSGAGKSVAIIILSYALARGGVFRGEQLQPARILFIDTDNPRSLLHARLKKIVDSTEVEFDILSRDKAPKLLDRKAWEALPADKYDVIILDSFGGATPGIGEKDAGPLQNALKLLCDVANKGPAVIVLENTVKSVMTYRGRGEKVERVDVFYEVRDVSQWRPFGDEAWWEQLPSGGDEEWQSRASRRHNQGKIRLAWICRKYRWGEEPEPFAVEIDFETEPWSLRDCTNDLSEAGKAAKEEAETKDKHAQIMVIAALQKEVQSRSDDDVMGKNEAVDFLCKRHIKRNAARNLIEAHDAEVYPSEGRWRLIPTPGKGGKIGVFPLSKPGDGGLNRSSQNPSNDAEIREPDFGHPDNQRLAEIGHVETHVVAEDANEVSYAAEVSLYSNDRAMPTDEGDDGELEVREW
jgi:hypothetical protein